MNQSYLKETMRGGHSELTKENNLYNYTTLYSTICVATAICFSNKGITLPLLPKTLPKRTATYSVFEFLLNEEVSKPLGEMNSEAVDNYIKILLHLQDKHVELSPEFIDEQVRKIFHKEEIAELCQFNSRINKNFNENFKRVFDLDEDLIDTIGRMRKEKDRIHLATIAVEEMYHDKELEFGEDTMRKIEREVYLQVLDTLWMQHLENMQHLREGIHWRSVGQRDPLVEYRAESQKLFDGLQRALREEVMHILLSIRRQEVGKLSDDKYDTELTKMAEGATEKGVNEISAGPKNMDDEFSKDEHGISTNENIHHVRSSEGKPTGANSNRNAQRNAARKSKKKARQNKKNGRR